MPPSRLRESTSAQPELVDHSLPPARSTRPKARKSYAMESESEEDEDEDEEDEMEDADRDMNDLNDSEDADGDVDMQDDLISRPNKPRNHDRSSHRDIKVKSDLDVVQDDSADDGLPLGAPLSRGKLPPTAPAFKLKGPTAPPAQIKITGTPTTQTSKLKSVEEKEMQMSMDDEDEDDDEELSDLGSDDEEGDEDAEGDLDDEEADFEDDDMDEDGRSLDASLGREGTPDLSKMTKRQRGRVEVMNEHGFMQLPMEPQIKKHLTAEEHAMRRAEMARRRKNLSEKRNEEEKADTINRLLKKQAPKRRGKISAKEIEQQDRGDDEVEGAGTKQADDDAEDEAVERPVLPANPIYVRWISSRTESKVGIPAQWMDGPLKSAFGNTDANPIVGTNAAKLIQQV